jgi:hypothetical protein
MSTSEERGRLAADHQLNQERLVELARVLKSKNYTNSAIAHILRLSESTVRTMVDENEINWGFNCLTTGIHHGRPEAIWNIPLLHAIHIYHREMLRDLVISRIHKDALQFTLHNQEYTTAWANRVRAIAQEKYRTTIQHTVGELSNYYNTPEFERGSDQAARLFAEDKLNPGYKPLHGHDSINMLCRILGTKASREASS